jgi:glycosyltransferase involved in cell wall biosynthesis
MKVTLSLLAYNEEEVIERVVRDAVEHLAAAFAPGDWELLLINDGSRDKTGALCDELSTQIEGVRVYHHDPNRGYVEATLSAMREARGDYICVFDGDGQQTAADVPRIVQKLESGCDVVFGWKKERQDGTTRHTLSWGLRMMARSFCTRACTTSTPAAAASVKSTSRSWLSSSTASTLSARASIRGRGLH